MLRNAVINNLVPEERRNILFTTEISEDHRTEFDDGFDDVHSENEVERLEERLERLELIVRKLVELLVKRGDSS